MNLPNKLTILRVVLVPFFVAFLLIEQLPYHFLLAFVVFVLASFTDALDGYIARHQGLITTFGKFMDPLADKILVISAFICFVSLNLASPIVLILVMAREFMVTSLRLVVATDGVVIEASMFGKVKTVIQMVSIVIILAMMSISQIVTIMFDVSAWAHILMWLSAAVTVISGVHYLIVNKSVFLQDR